MSPEALAAFREHTIKEYPREACGLLVAAGRHEVYVPGINIADNPEEDFVLAPMSYVVARQRGEVIAVCHSHPNEGSRPSEADLAQCEAGNLPWHILSWPGDELYSFRPSGYVVPLLGRPFVAGVHDCYGLVRDYYKQKLQIELPDFERGTDWWEDRPGRPHQNLIMENFEAAGFFVVPAEKIAAHDVIIMQLGTSLVPQHCAIYIGDMQIMHHITGQISNRTIYGGYWQKCTTQVVRHRDMM